MGIGEDMVAATDPRAPTAVTPTSVPRTLATLAPGDRIGGYRVVRRIGAGGMGEVYLARDERLARDVAVKVVRAELARADARDRLLHEAQALARLTHPNVVTVYECGLVGDQVFIAMEYVPGGTLRAWLAAPRTWREIVRVFVAAGRGLAAAHGADLVHRDFKPENVLVGDDDRVRVVDFGLAGDAAPREDGAIAGTPAYMAPEQHDGGEVDARCDQFAFGVALWEAVSGVHPLAATTYEELRARARAVTLAEPDGRAVPGMVRAVSARATRARPEERFPSMDALLAELSRDPAAGRRRVATAGAIAALGTIAIVGWSRGRASGPTPCVDAGRELDAVWNRATADRVRERFAATGRPYAADTAARATAAVDAYASTWRDMRRDACMATAVRREQSEAMLELRMACLDRRAAELRAITTLFTAKADVGVLDHAVQAVRDLPPVGACADRAALADAVPPPPGKRAAIESVRARLDQAKARDRAGAYADALATMPSIVTDARAIGYPALLADALATDGDVLVHAGRAGEATAPLREAIRAAALAHVDATAIRAWRMLLRATALDGHPEVALALAPGADAAVARGGDDPIAAARLLVAIEPARSATGDDAGARAAAEQAVALYEQAGAPPLERADAQVALERVLAHTGDYDGARAAGERALALYTQELGPEHPFVAGILMNLGGLAYDRDDYAAAEAHLRRSLAIDEKALGPDHPDTGRVLALLAEVLRVQARFDEARPLAERSLAIKVASLGPDHPDVANSLTTVGALAQEAGDLAAARADHTRALAIREKALGPDNPMVADSLIFLGDLDEQAHELGKARAEYERAIAILRGGTAGARPEVVRPLIALARNDLEAGRLDDVLAHGREAIAIIEKTAGPDALTIADALEPITDALLQARRYDEALASATRWLAVVEHADPRYLVGPLADQAEALRGLHRVGDAVAPLERALAVAIDQDQRRKEPNTAHELAGVRFALARALWDSHGDRARARQLAIAARADLGRAGADATVTRDVAELDAWLATHDPG